jgi:hypothetical protein
VPTARFTGGKEHPGVLVESAVITTLKQKITFFVFMQSHNSPAEFWQSFHKNYPGLMRNYFVFWETNIY